MQRRHHAIAANIHGVATKMTDNTDKVTLAAELTAAWLANPNTRAGADDVPSFLRSTFQALEGLSTPAAGSPQEEPTPEYTAAVSARKSLANPNHILSMIDGKPYKTLRRHLATNGLTPEQYRERFGLKADYPMVAPNYSESRRAMAKQIGLGRKPAQADSSEAAEAPEAAETVKPKRRGRKNAAEGEAAA